MIESVAGKLEYQSPLSALKVFGGGGGRVIIVSALSLRDKERLSDWEIDRGIDRTWQFINM